MEEARVKSVVHSVGESIMTGIFRSIKELFRFNLVSPYAQIGKNVRIDHFTTIERGVTIGDDCWIGSCTHIRPGTYIGSESEVRDQCYIAGNGVSIGPWTKILQQSNVAQGTKIGNNCFLSVGFSTSNVKRMNHNRRFSRVENETTHNAPSIGDWVRTGNGVLVLPGVRVGRECLIGSGSVVVKSTDPHGVYVGNPATRIKNVDKAELVNFAGHFSTEPYPETQGRGCIIGKNVWFGPGVRLGHYCVIQDDCIIGEGTELANWVLLKRGTKIGKNCFFDSYSLSSGENEIGDNVTVRYQAMIARGVVVEDDVYLSGGAKTAYVAPDRSNVRGIRIGRGAFLGDDVKILNGVKVAAGTILGANAVVTKDIDEPGVYIGVPAKKLRDLTDEEKSV